MTPRTTKPPPKPRAKSLAPVVLVMGKGGVGRTTLAAGLAVLEAQTRGAAVLVEFGDGASGRRALGSAHRQVEHVVIRADEAIRLAATPLFHSAILARLALNNFAMRPLLRVAPAVRELAMLESVRRVCADHPGVRVVVDMPATGHSVAWLRAPEQGTKYLHSGALYEFCEQLVRELLAPGRSSLVVVTLPERLVLEETLELCRAIVSETAFKVDELIVNRMPVALSHAALQAARCLAAQPGPLAKAAGALAAVLLARESAREEALSALSAIPIGAYGVGHLPLAQVDPSATEVARWLAAAARGE